MNVLQKILLVLGLLVLLKAVAMLFCPAWSRRVFEWWAALPAWLLRFVGVCAILVGVVVIGFAVAAMREPVVGALTIAGTVFVVAGMLYQWPAAFRIMATRLGPADATWVIRLVGLVVFAVAVALLLIWGMSLGSEPSAEGLQGDAQSGSHLAVVQ